SMRSFNADTQRSIAQLDEVRIPPVTETILPIELWDKATNRIKAAYEKTNSSLEAAEAKEVLGSNLLPTIEALENREWNESFSFYTHFLYEETNTIIDYFPEDAVILYDEYPRILESNQKLAEEELSWIETQLDLNRILKDQLFSHDFLDEQRKLDGPRVYFSLLQKGMGSIKLT